MLPLGACYTGLWEFPKLQACCVDPWLAGETVLEPAALCWALAPVLAAAEKLGYDVLSLHITGAVT